MRGHRGSSPMGSWAPARQACRMTDDTRNEHTSDQPDDQRTGPTERLPRDEEGPPAAPPPGETSGDEPRPKRLTRSGADAVIGGVGSGLGRYFGVDPLLFRIGFVVLSFAGGFGVLAYLLLLAFMPADGDQR